MFLGMTNMTLLSHQIMADGGFQMKINMWIRIYCRRLIFMRMEFLEDCILQESGMDD